MKRPATAALVGLLALSTACVAQAGSPAASPLSATDAEQHAPAPSSPLLVGGEGIVPLQVPGFGDAVVSLPLGARGPRPVLVVTHGNHDDPESHCNYWRQMVQNHAFVLCARGTRRADGSFTHGTELPAEVDADVAALRARYGGLVDPGPMMYSGFSQGAGLGPGVVMRNPSRFTRVVMIEGGMGGWNEKTSGVSPP